MEKELLTNTILSQEIESLAMIINPNLSKEYMNIRLKQREESRKRISEISTRGKTKQNTDNEHDDRRDINIDNIDTNNADEVSEVMKLYYDTAPDTITIPSHVMNQNKFILPTFNRDKIRNKTKRRFIDLGVSDSSNSDIQSKEPNIDNDSSNISQGVDLSSIKITPKKTGKKVKLNLHDESGDNNANG